MMQHFLHSFLSLEDMLGPMHLFDFTHIVLYDFMLGDGIAVVSISDSRTELPYKALHRHSDDRTKKYVHTSIFEYFFA